jgi:hypothetical protein
LENTLLYCIDKFAVLDHVTNTEGVSLVQVNTWLLAILGIFVTVILALFVYMNGRFADAKSERTAGFLEAKSERTAIAHDLTDLKVAFARQEAILKLAITLKGPTLAEVDIMIEEELKKQQEKLE